VELLVLILSRKGGKSPATQVRNHQGSDGKTEEKVKLKNIAV
jgi:hypothetical protein